MIDTEITEIVAAGLRRVLAKSMQGAVGRVNNIFVNPDQSSGIQFPIVFATVHGRVRVAVSTEGDNIVFAPEGGESEFVVSREEILGRPC